jgi:glycerate kinase
MCNLAESVLSERFPTSDVTKVPLTDGGEGFCEILTLGVQGVLHSIEVLDSVGSKQKVQYGICDVEKLSPKVIKFLNLPSRGNLGIVEMAQAAGLADLPESKRNPWETSTFGVGQILKEVAGFGVDVILLGIGGSSTNDIGIGALNALGLSLKSHDNNEISFPIPSVWKNVAGIDIDGLDSLPPIRIACDVDNQLFGKTGATAQYGPQKGLAEKDIEKFQEQIKRILKILESHRTDIFELSKSKGSGAAGGMGFGLSIFYDVSLVHGFDLISSWFEIDHKIEEADYVITGEGRFDQTSLCGKGPFEIIRLSNLKDTPSLVMAGSVDPKTAIEISGKFTGCDLIPFGRSDWSLDKNLSRANQNFTETLTGYEFPNLN